MFIGTWAIIQGYTITPTAQYFSKSPNVSSNKGGYMSCRKYLDMLGCSESDCRLRTAVIRNVDPM